MDQFLPFSVIIPVKDRPRELSRAIEATLRQTACATEIIIVDQSESDECRLAVGRVYGAQGGQTLPVLKYIHDRSIDGLTAARNRGLRLSTCPVVIYCDDDSTPDFDSLRLLVAALAEHPDLVGVGGIITNYTAPPLWLRCFRRTFYRGPLWDERQPVYWNWDRYAPGQLIPTRKLNGGLMAIRTAALRSIGGFDERYCRSAVGEDIEVSARLARHCPLPSGLALIGGAWLEHRSLGEWKMGPSRLLNEVVAAHYLFANSTSGRAVQRLCYAWMVLGNSALAVVASARRLDLAPLWSLATGLRCVLNGYKGCPFLKSEEGLC